MSWGAKRRFLILAAAFGIMAVLFAWYGFSLFYSAPSCSDGKLNQGESGVDCGGPCARLCENQTKDMLVLWQRAFEVTPDSYNVVAYAENPNPNSVAKDVSYVFNLYDSRNILVAERSGVVSIPPQRIVPIFEGDIKTGQRVPTKVKFVLLSAPVWTSVRTTRPELRVVDQFMSDVAKSPLLTARIQNDSENISVRNLPLVAIVYDSDGNARAVSRTVVDSINPLGSQSTLFSWPRPFDFTAARIEITPLVFPGAQY